MGASERGVLPPDLARGRSRFRAWRGRRQAGGRIPRRLWALAVRLVNRHGVSRTAAALGLDYYSLKERAGQAADQPRSSGPAFVGCLPRSRSASSVSSDWIMGPGPPCACNWSATTRPMSRPCLAASGTPSNVADHAADEDPCGRRAGRFSLRHRWPGTAVPGNPSTRPVHRRGLCLPQSQRDGAEGAHLRWPRVLALPQAALSGPFPVVALGRGRRRSTAGRPPTVGVALGRQPDANGRGRRLASGGPADLTRPPSALAGSRKPCSISLHSRIRRRPHGRGRRRTPLAAGCRRMRNAPEIVEVDSTQLEEVLRRVEQSLDEKDTKLIRAVFESYVYVADLVEDKNTSIRRLRQLFFGARTEKTEAVVGRPNREARRGSAAWRRGKHRIGGWRTGHRRVQRSGYGDCQPRSRARLTALTLIVVPSGSTCGTRRSQPATRVLAAVRARSMRRFRGC